MLSNEIIHAYWQHGLEQQALAALKPAQFKNSCMQITSMECTAGHLQDYATVQAILATGTSMVVVPTYAERDADLYVPYVLLVDLDSSGSFIPSKINPMPIIPKALLEPAALCPISLGATEAFDDYVITQPPIWHDNPSLLTWTLQLEYAQQMFNAVTSNVWQKNLAALDYYLQDSAIIFPVSSLLHPATMNISILKEKNTVEMIEAERNSGKSSYAMRLILDAWINAAMQQGQPPKCLWLRDGDENRYSTIFDFVANTDIVSDDTYSSLALCFHSYVKGKQVVRNWQAINKTIEDKYADKGGIQSRVRQLQAHLKEVRARNRHLQVLYSIWIRQCELVTGWYKLLDFIPLIQRYRLHRLFVFFKQNFPDEKVSDVSQSQLEDIIVDKVARANNSERFIADALHQIENDQRQEELIRDKCLQWSIPHDENATTLSAVETLLEDTVWHKLLVATGHYWKSDFVRANGHDNFLMATVSNLDLLIVEHAEYISPMSGAALLSISKRAVIMGNNNPICIPRFPVQVDYNLAKHLRLVTCDEEFEDLQFDGVLASIGNLWNLALQHREVDKTFPSQRLIKLRYEFINIMGHSEDYFGSRINTDEVSAILQWLDQNSSLVSDLRIFTTFAGQREYLQNTLNAGKFKHIQVHVLQEPSFTKSAISLFSPVYTISDPTPYNFDRGMEIINNLIDSTVQQIIVFGDQRIFRSDLHSASGKFAKSIFITQEQEVASV